MHENTTTLGRGGRRSGGKPGAGRSGLAARFSAEHGWWIVQGIRRCRKAVGAWHFPEEARAWFDEAASLRYPFQRSYSAGDYLAQLAAQFR